MRSFIILASMIIATSIKDINYSNDVTKFIGYAIIIGFIMDLVEVLKKTLSK
jgi:hypothetical protein